MSLFSSIKKIKIPDSIINLSKIIYENSYKYLLFIWTIYSIMFFLQTNYELCIEKYINSFSTIKTLFIYIFIMIIFHIMLHLSFLKDNKVAMEDKEYSKIVPTIMNEDQLYFLIMPIYALWIYALSKVIKYLYNFLTFPKTIISSSILELIVWGVIFVLFLSLWFIFKHKAKKTWDFFLTLFVIFITLDFLHNPKKD